MAYTHDFDIKVDGIHVEGEMDFGPGAPGQAKFKTTLGEEMTLGEHAMLQKMFEKFQTFYRQFGDIVKIELTKKI